MITLRSEKGAALTHAEMDANFATLKAATPDFMVRFSFDYTANNTTLTPFPNMIWESNKLYLLGIKSFATNGAGAVTYVNIMDYSVDLRDPSTPIISYNTYWLTNGTLDLSSFPTITPKELVDGEKHYIFCSAIGIEA